MQRFTGMQYLYIDIANAFGLDKEVWEERIKWTSVNEHKLEALIDDAEDRFLFAKAVNALRVSQDMEPSGHMMGLDSTASGLQIMACLIGCHDTARNVNLINTGNREDVYAKVALTMNELCADEITKKEIKTPLMTTFYGSMAQPKRIFGEGTTELAAFYETLNHELKGAMEVLADIQSCWQGNNLFHKFALPDGHVAKIKVMVAVDKKIEVDELDHATFTHRALINEPVAFGISLCANIVHAIDGYIVRQMVRKANAQGFELVTIHDNFLASPNNMNEVRQNYIDIMVSIANSDLLQSILRQVTNNNELTFTKYSDNLGEQIANSEYALS